MTAIPTLAPSAVINDSITPSPNLEQAAWTSTIEIGASICTGPTCEFCWGELLGRSGSETGLQVHSSRISSVGSLPGSMLGVHEPGSNN